MFGLNPGSPIIEIRNATVYRGATLVFSRLNLTIERGENTAILGPNGAGKTTLLKLLSREIYPVAGKGETVRIMGMETWNVRDLRSHLGIVGPDLQEEYARRATGREVVLSGFFSSSGLFDHLKIEPRMQERANEVLAELAILDLQEKRFEQLSTGERRRFLLARALIHNPDILVLDEPTTGLDLRAAFQLLHIIREQIQKGRTVLMITHRLLNIPPEIERVILLRKGEIFASGPKREVLTSQNLSELFQTPLRLLESDGYYRVIPG